MLQDTSAQPAQPGQNSNADALKQMGFDHLIHNFDALGWIVFVVLVAMSVLSWYFIVANFIRNSMVRSRADKVIQGFWNTSSTQEAIRMLEVQPTGLHMRVPVFLGSKQEVETATRYHREYDAAHGGAAVVA